MAAIDTYLQDIVDAVYGEEVRWSIHDAISAMNTESTAAESAAISAQNSATAKATEAASSASSAATSATSAARSAAGAQQYAQGGLHYKGSIIFSQIPVSGMVGGDMYNMSEDFVTDNRFIEGAGHKVKAGTNIAWSSGNNKWDILAIGGAGVGKDLSGQTVKPTYSTTVTAGDGAEIFNDYEDRTYSASIPMAGNVASGRYSHAEGSITTASGGHSHAEGFRTTASGNYSHAEGSFYSEATGESSHAEGDHTTASGRISHAEGYSTTASGNYSHAEGYETTAGYSNQHVSGKYNNNKSDTLLEIGNGPSSSNKSNAFEVTSDGYIRTHNNNTKIAFGVDSNGDYGYLKTESNDIIPFGGIITDTQWAEITALLS